MVHVGNLLRGQIRAACGNLLFVLVSHEEEAFQLRVGAEQFQTQRPGSAEQQPQRRHHGYPDVFGAFHLHQDNGAQHQGYSRQHLVRDAEQRPQALHAAQRVYNALIQQITPQTYAARSTQNTCYQRVGFLQERHEVTQQILQHEAACTRTGIQRGEDEQRFKQNTEVVPEAHVRPRQHFVEHVCDTHRQRRCATCAVQHGWFADVFRGLHNLLRRNHEAPGADGRRRVCAGVFQLRHNQRGIFAAHLMQVWHGDAETRWWGVHREVQPRLDNRRRNQRHDRHEGFHQHRAVTDEARVGFVGHQLRRGAGGDQRVEARHGTAGNGDKQEREQGTFPQRTGTVNVLRHRRHFQLRVDDHNPDCQPDDHADFQEGRQVVTRSQNQPHRQQR